MKAGSSGSGAKYGFQRRARKSESSKRRRTKKNGENETRCLKLRTSRRSTDSHDSDDDVLNEAIRRLKMKRRGDFGDESNRELDEYARTLIELGDWKREEQSSSEEFGVVKQYAIDALVLSRLYTLMRKKEPAGTETVGIARQIVNISFIGLCTRTLRIREWPRGTAIFDAQPKECNEYLAPRMKLMNAKVSKGSSLRRVDFNFIDTIFPNDDITKTRDDKIEDALRKEGFREEIPTIWICEDLNEIMNKSTPNAMSDFVEEICDLMSRESECVGSINVQASTSENDDNVSLQNTIKTLFASNGALCSFTEEENGSVLFSAVKLRRSSREEEYYRNELINALEAIDEDGWED